jgi:hypothetical protein
MDALFSKQAVSIYRETWEKMKRGEALSGVAEMIAEAMRAHPEFDAWWPQGEAAFHPQEIDGYIVNPLVHIGLHVAIEKQLESEEPEEAVAAFRALRNSGIDAHEAAHRLAGLWGDLYFRSVRRGGSLDEGAYLEELRAMTAAASGSSESA